MKTQRLKILLFFALGFAPCADSFAQNASTLQEAIQLQSEISPLEEGKKAVGRALVFVFENGLPKEGVTVEVAGRAYSSDSGGVIRLELPEGVYTLNPQGFEGGAKFDIVSSEETEVILNLLPPDHLRAESTSPETIADIPPLAEAEGQEVRLRVFSQETRQPVSGATLLVSGYSGSLSSGERGEFLLRLPPGRHSITILHPSFETLVHTDELDSGGFRSLGGTQVLNLKPAISDLEEFVVLAPKVKGSVSALVEVRKNSSAVSDVLGSEQMARQGDSDAGSSLRRVTGLTLVGGKFVYVRGLGERYSSVTMNGSSLPSPEPARRVVPLDLFPTSVLESVVVQKSFTPGLPGEFGGGLIQLQTRSLPARPFLKASVSRNLEGKLDRLTYAGGTRDWMGIDDGTRALPESIRRALESGKKLNENNPPFFTNGFSPEELAELGRSLPVRYNTSRSSDYSLPGLSLSGGTRTNAGSLALGALFSVSHSSTFETGSKEAKTYDAESAEKLSLYESSRSEFSEREVKSSGTLDLGAEVGNQSIHGSLLLVRHATDETTIKSSTRTSDSVTARKTTSLEWVERELFTKQLSGKHLFPMGLESPLEWNWRATESIADRDAPDMREYVYEERTGTPTLGKDNNGNRRSWSELKDKATEIGTEISQELKLGFLGSAKFTAGLTAMNRERNADTWRLHMRIRDSNIDLSRDPDSILSPANIHPGGIELTNLTESADSMSAEQKINSYFVATDWSPLPQWTLSTGIRRESGRQLVKTFYYYDRSNPTSVGGLDTTDWLPSHSLTWKPHAAVRARLAYSETVARPEFRELSTVPFIDDETGYETVGYEKLRGTVIRNYDHRWEFYPTPEESASIGFFYKEFDSPIEEVFEPSPNLRKTFRNVEKAKNAGVEVDGRMDLRRISRYLRRWSMLGNVSLIRSRVVLGEEAQGQQTTSKRPLQGQSPWVVNLQLQYDRPAAGRTLGFLYNVVGPRITEVGTNLRPDIYEQPFHQVDFIASQKISRNMNVGFKAKNLLDPEARATQGEFVVRNYRKGRSFNVSLSATF